MAGYYWEEKYSYSRKPGQVEETAMDAGSREVGSEQCVEMVAL
jgi:hypothetical protein